ncbi:unnamed protein product [Nippostrongylus brasiliensis]|uniref:Uncharacterized protein n=1 Tax=Nippostrongylus brasiliensis TaxID=27835 RepID=A0A0N4XDM5_NIPBR|nr:hypothetical protein Q1695_016036 [Nippostrongylus brasiliensis]VDL63432.1 unnamed protein product [Nippostrongylus brasiliensis]
MTLLTFSQLRENQREPRFRRQLFEAGGNGCEEDESEEDEEVIVVGETDQDRDDDRDDKTKRRNCVTNGLNSFKEFPPEPRFTLVSS